MYIWLSSAALRYIKFGSKVHASDCPQHIYVSGNHFQMQIITSFTEFSGLKVRQPVSKTHDNVSHINYII